MPRPLLSKDKAQELTIAVLAGLIFGIWYALGFPGLFRPIASLWCR